MDMQINKHENRRATASCAEKSARKRGRIFLSVVGVCVCVMEFSPTNQTNKKNYVTYAMKESLEFSR